MNNFPDTKSTLSELPETLRWLRKMRSMTLRQVSESIGLSVSFLSDLERGVTMPSLKTLQKLAGCYQSPILLYFEANRKA